MTVNEIDLMLQGEVSLFTKELLHQIQSKKKKAIKANNEELANSLWCFEAIFRIHQLYLDAWKNLNLAANSNDELIDEYDSQKSILYEKAWNALDDCEISSSELENCFCIPKRSLSMYHIDLILHDVKRLQSLFPYTLFGSREDVVKAQRCSICNTIVSIRHPCGHIPGKLYMGEMCYRIVTDIDFLGVSLVRTPLDKCAIIKSPGYKYDFSLLDSAVIDIVNKGGNLVSDR